MTSRRCSRGGISLAWPAASRFEYSNLAYAILGRVIERVTGGAYDDAIRSRLLEPLGITAVFDENLAAPERRAAGYVRRNEGWHEETIHGHGAFAPMGGLWASVRDISRWVAGFTDAFPARDDPEDGHPLRRSSRREMQQIHAPLPPEVSWTSTEAAPTVSSGGYGMGLFATEDLSIGRTVGHGGGYPGFGSNMRWHPASGYRGRRPGQRPIRTGLRSRQQRRCGCSSRMRRPGSDATNRGPRPPPRGRPSSGCWTTGTRTSQPSCSP